MRRFVLLAALLSLASPPPPAVAATPSGAGGSTEMLSDSTVVDRWTLDNGLRVQTRHIPRSTGVSITVGYAIGSDQDPPEREGLAQLLGYIGFTAPAGQTPERTIDEMDSQRPLGWSFPVSRRTTLFTEVASIQQFPGVLSQVAERMRGVKVTPDGLRAAVKEVQRELGEQLFGAPNQSLHFQVREVALAHDDEAVLKRASAKGLEQLSPREVEDHLRRLYVPANAFLSIVGNLEGVDVRRLVDGLFADLPGGAAQPPPAPGKPLAAGSRIVMRSGIPGPAGVVGLLAPALEDTLHPSFYLGVLLLGVHMGQLWPRGDGGPQRYLYAVLDEPDLARFYPPLAPTDRSPDVLSKRMNDAVETMREKVVTGQNWRDLRTRTAWQLGGPIPNEVLGTVRQSPILLLSLSRGTAARNLYGGEAFWAEYRRRFEEMAPGVSRWYPWFLDPQKQVRLLYAPR